MRTNEEIYEQIDKANEFINDGGGMMGMSYEEGVKAALEWVKGDIEDAPIED